MDVALADVARIMEAMNGPVSPLVLEFHHRELARLLNDNKDNAIDLNWPLRHPLLDMTPLEFSVFHGDWKMACILLAGNADPNKNVCEGQIQTQASYHGVGDPFTLPGFQHVNPGETPIPGFAGLRALLDPEEAHQHEIMKAYLFLVESCCGISSKSDFKAPTDIRRVVSYLQLVCSDHQYDVASKLELQVFTVLCACRKKGIPRVSARLIVEFLATTAVRSFFLQDVVQEFLTNDDEEGAGDDEGGHDNNYRQDDAA